MKRILNLYCITNTSAGLLIFSGNEHQPPPLKKKAISFFFFFLIKEYFYTYNIFSKIYWKYVNKNYNI